MGRLLRTVRVEDIPDGSGLIRDLIRTATIAERVEHPYLAADPGNRTLCARDHRTPNNSPITLNAHREDRPEVCHGIRWLPPGKPQGYQKNPETEHRTRQHHAPLHANDRLIGPC